MRTVYSQNAPYGATGAIYCAMRMVMKYAHRTPQPDEVQRDLKCSRATAYRYVRAMKDAKGES